MMKLASMSLIKIYPEEARSAAYFVTSDVICVCKKGSYILVL